LAVVLIDVSVLVTEDIEDGKVDEIGGVHRVVCAVGWGIFGDALLTGVRAQVDGSS
jgi:hypothetical protein